MNTLSHDRIGLPPPVSHDPSPTLFVARMVLVTIGIALAAAVVLTTSLAVLAPLGIVLAGGLALVAGDRWAQYRRDRKVPTSDGARARHGRDRTARPGALGTGSIALLVAALIVPEALGVVFAVTGLAGLIVASLGARSQLRVRARSLP